MSWGCVPRSEIGPDAGQTQSCPLGTAGLDRNMRVGMCEKVREHMQCNPELYKYLE